MTIIKPYIGKPCFENWDDMKIGVCSRHCLICDKEVMDFRQMDRPEILQYIFDHNGERICARFRKTQLDFTQDEILAVYKKCFQKKKNSNFPFYLLTIGSLSLVACNKSSDKQMDKPHVVCAGVLNDVAEKEINEDSSSLKKEIIPLRPRSEIVENETMGIVLILDNETQSPHQENTPSTVVDVMPEFVGGLDSLTKYIENNLHYPKRALKDSIEGRVVVRFVVNKEGKIKNHEVVRGVSPDLDNEALRLIKGMPDWKSGQLKGINVDTYFTLPILFRIER